MCNQEVKFRLFLDTALGDGADLIATGHYARIADGQLLAGVDRNKDQSYFLYRITEDALRCSLMPIGEYEKPYVRELARKFGLATAAKKDSQGICFVGNVGIKDFLLHELGEQPHGAIIDQHGTAIGQHDGALFYTIGQRHGLQVGGGLPYYVTGKDMAKNELYVTTDLQDEKLWHRQLLLADMHWINGEPDMAVVPNADIAVRTRYRAPLVELEALSKQNDKQWKLTLADEVRALTPGQSAVLYRGQQVLGGGIVM